MDIDKIIKIVRNLNEEGEVNVPTNSSNSSSLGFDPYTETPPVDLRRGKRRNWNIFFKNLVKMQRRIKNK
jgi:hypothetical protein